MSDELNTEGQIKWVLKHIILPIGLIIMFFILAPFSIIGAGERGVVLNWSAFRGQIMSPGIHFRIPIMQSVEKINVQVQSDEIEKSEAYSKDLQIVHIHSVINWKLKPSMVGDYYTQYNAHFDHVLTPRLEACIKQTIAQYTAEEILHKRAELQTEIGDCFSAKIPDLVELVSYSLVNEEFTKEFEAAIEQKQIAQQNAEKANNELTRIKVEAEQKIATAQADAEAIRIQAQAVTQQGGKDYVQLKAVEKWDGKLPVQMIPGSTVPFLNLENK